MSTKYEVHSFSFFVFGKKTTKLNLILLSRVARCDTSRHLSFPTARWRMSRVATERAGVAQERRVVEMAEFSFLMKSVSIKRQENRSNHD